MSFSIKKYYKALSIVFAIAILFYIMQYIYKNIDEIGKYQYKMNWYYLLSSFFVCFVYLINQSIIWYAITKMNNCNISFLKTIFYRVYSDFGKYLPGKVWGYAMLFHVYVEEKKSQTKVSFSFFFELIASVLAAFIIFIFSFFFVEIQLFMEYRLISIVALLFLLVLLHPSILEYLSNIVLKILKRTYIKFELSYTDVLQIVFFYICNWLIFGISFILFVNSFIPVSLNYYFYITGAVAISGLIGMFAIFVPAGLGVRESVMIVALAEIMLKSLSGIIAILSRLWLTASEIFVFFIVFSIDLILKNRKH